MNELDDIDGLAAEFVLGTLPRDERADAAARLARDPAFAQAVAAWERRLGPLSELVAPVAPAPGLYEKIKDRIGLSPNVVSFQAREQAIVRRANRWRNAAAGMTALAASLAGVVVWQQQHQGMATQYVAVLQSGDEKPAFLLTVDTRTKMCVVSAIHAPSKPDHTYQVWALHTDMPEPKSLGVFAEGDMDVMPVSNRQEFAMLMDATFAVSVEPMGGSPTGLPTGPVVFSGKLVKATP